MNEHKFMIFFCFVLLFDERQTAIHILFFLLLFCGLGDLDIVCNLCSSADSLQEYKNKKEKKKKLLHAK